VRKVMLKLELEPEQADVAHVRRAHSLAASEIDAEFGVREINAERHLYVVLVERSAAARLKGRKGVSGPYSSPRITAATKLDRSSLLQG
jgi:hypothetical protein